MKTNLLQLIFDVLTLVAGLALEELLPFVDGIGWPFLLAASVYLARRRPLVVTVFLALAAGGAEDAASALPPMLSASYFLGVALLLRWPKLPPGLAIFAYPGYQLWLTIWTNALGGAVFSRLLVAWLVGMAALAVTTAVLSFLERKAALDEVG